MSPASYQTAPPRVVFYLGLRISDCGLGVGRTTGPHPYVPAKSAIRNLQSAIGRAGNGTRTRDPNLGKVVLYQLSYSRVAENLTVSTLIYYPPPGCSGGEGDRTPDLVNAIHALSQLSYAPAILGAPR